VVFLEVADDGLDGGLSFEFALDLRRDAAPLAARIELELVIGWGVVAAIAGIGDAAIEDIADERLHLRNDRAQRVPVIGIAGQCCGMGDELPAGGMFHRGGDAHFDTEFVRPVRFAFADALDLWGVQGIDLVAALAALLFQHAPGQEQRPRCHEKDRISARAGNDRRPLAARHGPSSTKVIAATAATASDAADAYLCFWTG
jgi:hypothetical protein